MWKAVVIDRDYGSVSIEKQQYLQKRYSENGMTLELEHCNTPEEIIKVSQDADAILCTGNPPVNKTVLESLPKLKIVQRFGIGVNSIDLDAATKAGVLILFMPGFCVDELALHSSALILNLLRNVSYYDRGIRQGEWRKAKGPVPRNPRDLVLGLFGFGGSAKPLCNIFLHGFETKVISYDPYVDQKTRDNWDVEFVSFDDFLARSDIISIHAPLTDETRHIFNREVFKKMKKDAMIINVARGELIQQDDLIWALEQGEIRFAGLDVFDKEPLPKDNYLTAMDNTILTCHSAFYGDHAQENQLQLAIDLVDAALNKKNIKVNYIANRKVQSKITDLAVL
jgi:D-3-phosphoglycerate dehydrogenase